MRKFELKDGALNVAKENFVIGSTLEDAYRDAYEEWQIALEDDKIEQAEWRRLELERNRKREAIINRCHAATLKLSKIREHCIRGKNTGKHTGII